jgi:apolipoprotein N-acyltransferase
MRARYGLALLSGVMLGGAFPPSPFGILACFGLVPLLVALSDLGRLRSTLKVTYVAMLVFHAITLNWTGGYAHGNDPYMMIAGGMTMLLHPLFYFLPLGAYHLVRKRFGEPVAVMALPFLWVGYEFSHSITEWSFPWITLGNTQTYDMARIQFISFTGVYGLSFWILLTNVLAYRLCLTLVRRIPGSSWRPALGWLAGLTLLYELPMIYGMAVLARSEKEFRGNGNVTVGIVQSNVDPWDKWKANGPRTMDMYLSLSAALIQAHPREKPQIILWPETAVPVYLLAPGYQELAAEMRRQIDTLGVAVLTGLPHAVIYRDSTLAPPSAKRSSLTGERYDSYNATAFFQPGVSEVPWYGKMKMVPLAERIPYADMFVFLDFMRWGVGIGGWQIGPDTVVYTEKTTGTKFASIICYESVYPGFVASFVRRGAEFIALVTIDSWWGKMSGAYQHAQFSVLRAVENRRWIARCAVGGISCFIDPFGRMYDRTELFTQAGLSRTIGRIDDCTFYTVHGDWFGEFVLSVAALIVAGAFVQGYQRTKKRKA